MEKEKSQRLTSNKGIGWQFNPPEAPNFGRVFKQLLKRPRMQLKAVFTGMESLLNSRPLTSVSRRCHGRAGVDPNHFLIGKKMGGQLAPDRRLISRLSPLEAEVS